MEELSQIISEATAMIDEMYFQLNIDGGDPIYRERVYCYELYHQMRKRWPSESDYYLNGEIDKAAHPILKKLGADNAKPDFLVHRPGYMEGNYAIIEVKHIEAPRQGVVKDLQTLSMFIESVGYERAIYLFYGYVDPKAIEGRIVEVIENEKLQIPLVELWVHNGVHSEAQHIRTFNT